MPPFLPFGEYLPDQPDFQNAGASVIKNVVPLTAKSYGPMPDLNTFSTNALTAAAQGAFSVIDNAGTVYTFAGDATKLYEMTAGSGTFANVSKGGGAPYTVGALPDGFWSFTAFGNRVIATGSSLNDPVQTFLLGTDAAFSDLAAAAPKAQFCAVIRDFLLLGSTKDAGAGTQKRRVWWSAIGDPTSWPTPGTTAAIQVQSDYQDLEQSDLGFITGLLGGSGLSGADGAVFAERGIYRVAYAGSPDIFDFAVAQGAGGTRSPFSIVQSRLPTGFGSRSVALYLGRDGFKAFDGLTEFPIGTQKIDATFFKDLDLSYLKAVAGVADPVTRLVFWLYHGPNNGGLYNRLLAYKPELGRWALTELATSVEWLTPSISLGYTLDQLDQFGTIDTLPAPLDSSVWQGGYPLIGMFDSTHKLRYLTGSNLAPTVETSETQIYPGRRAKIISARPICDGGSPSVAVGHRERIIDSVTYEGAIPVNVIGECPQRTTGRYVRFRMTLPAASAFTHLQGIDLSCFPEGRKQ